MDKNLDLEKLFGGNIGNIMNTVKLKCPTTKINLDANKEDKQHTIGMRMLVEKDLESTIELDNKDVHDDTIICIDRHQFVEAIGIIDGTLALMVSSNIITSKERTDYINKFINAIADSGYIMRYHTLWALLYNLRLSYDADDIKRACKDRLAFLTENIWFVPYGEMDRFYEKALTEFKEGKKDENNSKND